MASLPAPRRTAAPAAVPAWLGLAWLLWRGRRLSYAQVQRHLRAEGWNAGRAEIAEALNERLADEIAQRFA